MRAEALKFYDLGRAVLHVLKIVAPSDFQKPPQH
jgi:hypothetical protein